MAIIKCPECGHSVSDQALTCPNCGVQIANQIIICPDCGTRYLKSQTECPNCHHVSTQDIITNEQKAPNPAPEHPKPKIRNYHPIHD